MDGKEMEPGEEVANLPGGYFQSRTERHDYRCLQEIAEQAVETLMRTTLDPGPKRFANLPRGFIQRPTERHALRYRYTQVIVKQVGETLIRTTLDIGLKQVANLPGGYFQSPTERKRTQNGEGTSSDSISLETLQRHFGSKRKDVADSLGISISTLKRVCRFHGIPRWPHPKRKNAVSGHSDPHQRENPSPTFNAPSTNGQNAMENEMGGPSLEPTVYNETTTAWGSSQCVFQLEGQTTQSTAYPKRNVLLIPQPHIASTEVLNENIGGSENRRDLLASQAEATPSQALASVPKIPHIISHLTMGSPKAFHLENEMGGLIPEPNGFLPDSFELTSFENTLNDNFWFSSVHNGTEAARSSWGPNELVDPHLQAASTQIPSEIMGSLEDQSNFSAPQEEPLMGHVLGSVNGTVHSSSETALSQQPMATIPDAMLTISDKTPTILMMPHLPAREDTRSVMLKLTHGQEKIRFPFPLLSGIIELKEQVKKRLKKLDLDSFDVKYEDEDGDWILFGCDEDLRDHLQLFSNQVVSLLVVDSDANTLNFP